MHVNVLSELCPVSEPWKTPDKYDSQLTRLFIIDSNFSHGKARKQLLRIHFNLNGWNIR